MPCRFKLQSEKSILLCYPRLDEKPQLIKRLPAPFIRQLLASHRALQLSAQALAEKRSVLRPMPACPWWPYVWSLQTKVRVGDDGKVPIGSQRVSINAPRRSTVTRCLRPDGDVFFLRYPPDPKASPIVLLHHPVF